VGPGVDLMNLRFGRDRSRIFYQKFLDTLLSQNFVQIFIQLLGQIFTLKVIF
jgi:hypothetical protein